MSQMTLPPYNPEHIAATSKLLEAMQHVAETVARHYQDERDIPAGHEREIGMLAAQWANVQEANRLGDRGDHASASELGNLALTNVGQIVDEFSRKYPDGYPAPELRATLLELSTAWRSFETCGAPKADAERRRRLN